MKVKHFTTIPILLTSVLLTFSLAKISYSSTHLETLSVIPIPGEDIDATENFIFQETGKKVKVGNCNLYMCYFPAGTVSECSTNIGKFFITNIEGNWALSFGLPPDIKIEIKKL